MTLAKRIAKIIFDAGIRLDDEGALNAIGECENDKYLASKIAVAVLREKDIEITVNTSVIDTMGWYNETGLAAALAISAYEHARDRLTQEIDEELWHLQLQERMATKEDSAYEYQKNQEL